MRGGVRKSVFFEHFPRLFARVELIHCFEVFPVFSLDVVHGVAFLWFGFDGVGSFRACSRALRNAQSVRMSDQGREVLGPNSGSLHKCERLSGCLDRTRNHPTSLQSWR